MHSAELQRYRQDKKRARSGRDCILKRSDFRSCRFISSTCTTVIQRPYITQRSCHRISTTTAAPASQLFLHDKTKERPATNTKPLAAQKHDRANRTRKIIENLPKVSRSFHLPRHDHSGSRKSHDWNEHLPPLLPQNERCIRKIGDWCN